ncbi:MAG TPA: hypothetical protein PKE47_13375 [Verrucomicrobiota bacterium]|nr:hypothetical protein [Verrucomicrobiota bacterium]
MDQPLREPDPAADQLPLLRVCRLLNEAGARYLVIGGRALILHQIIRATTDVDILIEPTEENARRVIGALSRMEDGAARELTPRDLLDNVVVKIADEVEVDVSTHAWKISYLDARPTALETVLDGVRIPYLSAEMLIASKETYRAKDQYDVAALRDALARRREAAAAPAASGPKWPC